MIYGVGVCGIQGVDLRCRCVGYRVLIYGVGVWGIYSMLHRAFLADIIDPKRAVSLHLSDRPGRRHPTQPPAPPTCLSESEYKRESVCRYRSA